MSKNSTRMPGTGCGYKKGGKVSAPKGVPMPSKLGMALKKKKKQYGRTL